MRAPRKIIDSVVEMQIPYRWFDFSELDDFEDLLRVKDASHVLDTYKDHLDKVIDSAIRVIPIRWERFLPYPHYKDNVDGTEFRNYGGLDIVKSDIIEAFDSVIDFIMFLSKFLGYNTCEISSTHSTRPVDVNHLRSVAKVDDMGHFYWHSADQEFLHQASEWVARKFVEKGIITPECVYSLKKRRS